MTARSVVHDTFTVERRYDAPPARVFQAFADPAAKALWFGGPSDWERLESTFDFRVGTRLVYTEHGVYLDGLDEPRLRIEGTETMFDALGESLPQKVG